MKKKLSARDINMILVVVGLVLLVAVYFLVYQSYSTKNTELSGKITERQAHLTELQGYYDNLKSYEKGTAEGKANISSNLDKLPLGIKSEDFLVYIMDSTKSVNATLSSVEFKDEAQVSTFSTVVNNKKKECTGYQVNASFNGVMNYAQLKNYLDYVYNQSEGVTFVKSFSAAYNAEASDLNVSFDLAKYYITYDGSVYSPVAMPDVNIGIDDPFHTK